MSHVPVYYCLQCGYIGASPGVCPECSTTLMADDMHLPNETDEEKKYDDGLLDDEEEESEIDDIDGFQGGVKKSKVDEDEV